MTLGQLRNHLLKLVDYPYVAGNITLGNNEPLAQFLYVIDVAWGKHGVHTDDNPTSLNRSQTRTSSEVTCAYLVAMRTHSVKVIAIKNVIKLFLIKLDGLVIAKTSRASGSVYSQLAYSITSNRSDARSAP